jgi:hypothetical protein
VVSVANETHSITRQRNIPHRCHVRGRGGNLLDAVHERVAVDTAIVLKIVGKVTCAGLLPEHGFRSVPNHCG